MTEPTVYIRPSEPWDAEKINPRKIDRLEVESLTGRPFEDVVLDSINMCENQCWTAFLDVDGSQEIICIWGVVTHANDPTIGVPWLVGSDHVYSIKRYFLNESKGWVERIQGDYLVLTNLVHSKNFTAIKWLKFLGFTIGQQYELNGQSFNQFYRYKTNV